jgi:uncharacterized protein YciI
MTFFLCLRHPVRPRAEWTVNLREHLDWMRLRHADGSVVMSGPSRDLSVSIYLIRADSLESAEAIAAADPFTAGGDCRYEVYDWDVHQIMGAGDFENPHRARVGSKPGEVGEH